MDSQTRRDFLKASVTASTTLAAGPKAWTACSYAATAESGRGIPHKPGSKMKLGLVTYLWGQDWDLPTLIANCKKSGFKGAELRVDHAHKVSPKLTAPPAIGR